MHSPAHFKLMKSPGPAIALALSSALLMGIALPNELFHYGIPSVGFIALAPYFIAVRLCPTRKVVAWVGGLFGAALSLVTNFWLAFFHGFSAWTVTGVAAGMALYFVVLSPFFLVLSRVAAAYRPFAFAALWTVFEYVKSIGFLGFPWGLIGHTVGSILPLVQVADITGVWGVSFIIALCNAIIAETVLELATFERRNWRNRYSVLFRGSLASILLVAGTLGYGLYQLNQPEPPKSPVRIVLVQQNIDSWQADAGTEATILLQGEELTRQAIRAFGQAPDLVVWSESSLLRPYIQSIPYYRREPASDPFASFLNEIDTPLLVGGPYAVNGSRGAFMNATMLLGPDGAVRDYYGKQHLVPFAEWVPYWNDAPVRRFMQEVVGIEQIWTPGDRFTLFDLPLHSGTQTRFAVLICFEDGFAGLARRFVLNGADFLVNLTNTVWSRTVSAETQQFVAARFLAIENRRTLVRSTNSGVTSVVDSRGNLTASIPLFAPAYLAKTVMIERSPGFTPYTLFGDYLPIGLAGLVLIALLRSARRESLDGQR